MTQTSTKRRIPQKLFASSESAVAAFLAGFYDAEGNSGGSPRFFSANKDLLKDIQILLLRLGIHAHLYERLRHVQLPNQEFVIPHRMFWLQLLYKPDQESFRRQVPTLKTFAIKPRYVGEKLPVGPILDELVAIGLQQGKHLHSHRKDQQNLK